MAKTPYDIALDVSIGGKYVASPRIVTLPNEKAILTERNELDDEETFVEVMASDFTNADLKDGILMDVVVGRSHDGKREILSDRRILARPGKIADLRLPGKSADEAVRLKVRADRVTAVP